MDNFEWNRNLYIFLFYSSNNWLGAWELYTPVHMLCMCVYVRACITTHLYNKRITTKYFMASGCPGMSWTFQKEFSNVLKLSRDCELECSGKIVKLSWKLLEYPGICFLKTSGCYVLKIPFFKVDAKINDATGESTKNWSRR